MKEIDIKNLDLTIYNEKLSNGLDIYLLPYSDKKRYFIGYATKYGSDVLEFTDINKKKYKPPLGIAHFLEHKMFEQEDGIDPFQFFANSGTDGNASTTFDSTQYICYGTKSFNENLRYLLSFVNSPYYTDENVEKEKGIIAEEINMYLDMPDYLLDFRLRQALYQKHPRRLDIAGTVEEIYKITKEDLYDCYNNFYKPNNMFIIITGNFDKDEAIKIIKEELEKKEVEKVATVQKEKEPKTVNEKEVIIEKNIEVPKLGIGIKIPKENLNLNEVELDLYLDILTTILFGSSSLFRERVTNKKILSDMYTEWESIEDYKTFYLEATSIDIDSLLEEVKEEINNLNIDENSFERIKKVWIANEVKQSNNIMQTYDSIYSDLIKYNKVINNRIDIIRKMKYKKLTDLVEKLDLKNMSIVKMISKKK